ncbi:MAG TPA: histidine kinase, partial [Candidatus Dormibacteraeota bacterium]
MSSLAVAAELVDHPADERNASLEEALLRGVSELDAAIVLHRDTLATLSVERTTLAQQLAQAEGGLDSSPLGSDHHRRVTAAAEQLRVRLQAADAVADVAAQALADAERARATLLSAAPALAAPKPETEGGLHPPAHLFQVIEDERLRIARDMHDGPAQLLANLVLKAEIVERLLDHDPGLVRAELTEFKAIVRIALEETRRLIFDLRPMTLDDLGLVPTLRKFLADFAERWDIPCHFQVLGAERRIDRDQEAAFFRIVQEACTNARRHALAAAIDVTLSLSPRRITATVTDDGRGFDV